MLLNIFILKYQIISIKIKIVKIEVQFLCISAITKYYYEILKIILETKDKTYMDLIERNSIYLVMIYNLFVCD